MIARPLRLGAMLLLIPLAAHAAAYAPRPADGLMRLDYLFGVALECGLVDETVIAGYTRASETIVLRLGLSEASRLHTRAAAFIAVEREWSNRGLGGYRLWCRTEGVDAAAGFRASAGAVE